ncbi:MAG: hypothetical protein AAGG55_14875 [Pseudomonadota bacterium]
MRLAFMKRAVAAISWSVITLSSGSPASASIIHYQPDGTPTFTTSQNGGQPGSVQGLLERTGLDNPSYENTAITFLTPGTASDDVLLTFTFIEDTGDLNGVFGYFATSEVSDPTVGSSAWKNQAVRLAADSTDPNNGAVIFDDLVQRPVSETGSIDVADADNPNTTGSVRQLTVRGDLELGFVLWTNRNGQGEQLFSDQRANRDGDDPGTLGDDMLLSFSGVSSNPAMEFSGFNDVDLTLFAFEDVIFENGNGDNDYTDLVFTVTPELITGQTLPPENVVPAPAPAALIGVGLIALFARRRLPG